MLIYAFVSNYPSAYKAYCDNQFVDLLGKGHNLRIFAVRSQDTAVNEKVKAFDLQGRTHRLYPDDLRSLPLFAPRLAGAFASSPVERVRSVVRISNPRSQLKRRIKAAARMLTLPIDPPDLCLIHGIRPLTYLSWLRRFYPGIPIAVHHHGGIPAEGGTVDAERVAAGFREADVVFTNTIFSRRDAVDRGCDPDKVAILPVGFDLNDYRPANPRMYRPGGILRLTSVGRLSEGKGLLYALDAVAKLIGSGTHVRYTIVGSGVMRSALEEYVDVKGLTSSVIFKGTLSHDDVIAQLGRSDALVFPSVPTPNCTETQGAVIQEALLMKALVVTTRTGGVPESIPDVMRRFSAAPRRSDDLAAAMQSIYELPEADTRHLGDRGRGWVARSYDIRRLNSRMLEEIARRSGRLHADSGVPEIYQIGD